MELEPKKTPVGNQLFIGYLFFSSHSNKKKFCCSTGIFLLIFCHIFYSSSQDPVSKNKLLKEAEELHLFALRMALDNFGERNVQTAKHHGNLGRLYHHAAVSGRVCVCVCVCLSQFYLTDIKQGCGSGSVDPVRIELRKPAGSAKIEFGFTALFFK